MFIKYQIIFPDVSHEIFCSYHQLAKQGHTRIPHPCLLVVICSNIWDEIVTVSFQQVSFPHVYPSRERNQLLLLLFSEDISSTGWPSVIGEIWGVLCLDGTCCCNSDLPSRSSIQFGNCTKAASFSWAWDQKWKGFERFVFETLTHVQTERDLKAWTLRGVTPWY